MLVIAMATQRASKSKKKITSIPCTDPATSQTLGEIPVMDASEIQTRVQRARQAQALWQKTSFSERKNVLRHILKHLLDHADELCDLVVRDAGKTRENAMLGEVWTCAEKLRWTIKHGEKHIRPERVSAGLLVHKRATIEFQPLGVIGVICPWNYPLQNVLGPTIPALFAGNAVICKVSEWTSWSALRIQAIFDEALRASGYPSDLVQLVTGYAETGAALVSSGVDKVIFTGSIGNGRKVIQESAANLTPLILELGGKDALIVCDDADLDRSVHAALTGAFIASGQNCLAAERVLVFDDVYDQFIAKVLEYAKDLRQGPPLAGDLVDVGAMTMPDQVEIVERLVQNAVKMGAKVLTGGTRGTSKTGQFFEPTVLVDVTIDMDIMQHETFGPVMTICRIADEEEAIRVANDTQYGLGLTVMSKNPARARRIAEQVRTGCASMNDFALTYMAQDLPFGGVGGSGFGRLNGRDGLRACTNVKALLEDRFPLQKPAKLYPVKKGDYELARSVIRTLYSPSLSGKLRGIVEWIGEQRRR
jgi:acyl-CoA reductase-like NAD-dependent aldehyde dehydrogenase